MDMDMDNFKCRFCGKKMGKYYNVLIDALEHWTGVWFDSNNIRLEVYVGIGKKPEEDSISKCKRITLEVDEAWDMLPMSFRKYTIKN